MTSDDLERIYRTNLPASFQDALRAVYTQGYCDGAGITVTQTTPDKSASIAAPSTIVKLPFRGKG